MAALVVDAGSLFAQVDRRQPGHAAVVRVLRQERELLVTTEMAVAEADYLILDRVGVDAELGFLRDLVAGTYAVECLTRSELGTARELVQQYRDLRIGLTDASLVVLARRFRTNRI